MTESEASDVTSEVRLSGRPRKTNSPALPTRSRKYGNRSHGIPGFWWTGRIFWKGYHHTLDEADVYDVLPKDSTVKLFNSLAREWEKELYNFKTGGSPNLTKALWRCYRSQIAAFTVLILMEECLRLVQAVLLGMFIDLFNTKPDGDTDNSAMNLRNNSSLTYDYTSTNHHNDNDHHHLAQPDVFIIPAVIIIVYLFSIFLDHNFFHHGYRMRVATTSLIYRKVLRLCWASLTPSVMETIMNLVAKDMDLFHIVVLPATYTLIGPIQLGVTCYLLWDWLDLGPACVASLIILILLVPLQLFMGRLSRALREKCEDFTNNRLRRLQMLMSGLEEMLISNWTPFCHRVIRRARRLEISQMKRLSRLQIFNNTLTLTSGKVVVMATFVLLVVMNEEIDASKIFPALALLESLRLSMSILMPSGFIAMAQTMRTLKKVEEVLLLPEKSHPSNRMSSVPLQDDVVIRFSNYYAGLRKDSDTQMVLVDIDMDIEKNKLCCVIGPPESGKSFLLMAVLGELERHQGHVFHQGRLAFVPAVAWLCPGTIQENILFGTDYSHTRYTQVLSACSLTQIIDSLPLRDMTIVGERGLSLDQSIQAKITLARAVYQNCDIYLIDDVLKGMDVKSAMHIFKKCICGLLRSKTRLLVTDNSQHAQVANKVILMSQNQVHRHGGFDELVTSGVNLETFLSTRSYKNVEIGQLVDSASPLIQDLAGTPLALNPNPLPLTLGGKDSPSGSAFDILHADFKEPYDPLISSESNSSYLSSPESIYKTYFIIGGGVLLPVFFLFISLLEQAAFVLCEWWLAYWSENDQNVTANDIADNPVLGTVVVSLQNQIFIYIGLGFLTVGLGFLQALVFYTIAQHAGCSLHDVALEALLKAHLAFFDVNGKGAVLIHFLRDIGIVDSIPSVLFDSFQSFSILAATGILIVCINYWLVIIILPVTVLFLWARNRFHLATQDVEQIEVRSKNAVGVHVVSSMEGIQSVRSLCVDQQFVHKFDVCQDRSTAACYLHVAANRWFSIRVDLMGLAVVAGVLIGSVLVEEYQFGGMSLPASLVGLSLFYALNLINVNQPTLRKSAAVHFKMASVSRLLQYKQLTQEISPLEETSDGVPKLWPRYGIITCEGVSVDAAWTQGSGKRGTLLKNVWCCIRAQEKMGVIFSTASEQRAFLFLLFRLIKFSGIVRIDGVDITDVSKSQLRDKVSHISQNPTLFIGTVREFLDPDSRYTDAQVWKALDQVHLTGLVKSLRQKLTTDLVTISDNLTVGQKQLLRLATAVLHQSKVIVYEEPSSSLDLFCGTVIQSALQTLFPHSTVIHIAHLPDSIIHLDRIMIFHEGKIVEVDTPHSLLQSPDSQLSALVSELGSGPAAHLRQLALEKHENRPYVSPPIDPGDAKDIPLLSNKDLKAPNNLNVLPTFHSSRLAGVLNQLPTNKFSTDRL